MKRERDNDCVSHRQMEPRTRSRSHGRLSVLSWIGNAAAVLFGKHGDITAQARQAVHPPGCLRTRRQGSTGRRPSPASGARPRPTARRTSGSAHQLKDLQRQLRHQQRRQDDRVELGRDHSDGGRYPAAMGLSLNQIEDTFALLLPKGRAPDRSTVGHWVAAEHQAGRVLPALDALARPRAETMALDEIFFRRQPCLVGVEPASMALLLCQRSADRTAATWKQALTPFTGLNYVCTDAGTGLQKALAAEDAERRQQDRPPLERGLDHFHTAQEAQRVLGRLWKRVKALLGRGRGGRPQGRRGPQQGPRRPRTRGPRARGLEACGRRHGVVRWPPGRLAAGRQALTLLQPNGHLNDRIQAKREIAAACVGLPGGRGRRCVPSSRTAGR